MRTRSRLLASFLAGLVLVGGISRATTITVTSLVDALSVPGQTTFRGALQTANSDSPGDTIQFAPSLFSSGPATLSMAGTQFTISNSVTIVGPGQSSLTIDGQTFSRIFQVTNTSAVVSISGMTLTRGLASGSGLPGSGGGIYNVGNLSLQNVTVSSCKSNTNFISTDNLAYGGGGIFNLNATVSLNNVTLLNNTTSDQVGGGGMLCNGGTANIQNSTFTGNTTSSDGPGPAYYTPHNTATTMNNSTADTGIEVYTTGSVGGITLTNSHIGTVTISGTSLISNSTTGDVRTVVGTATISNSTVGKVWSSNYGNVIVDKSVLARLQQDYGNAVITNSTFKSPGNGSYAVSVGGGQGTTLMENDTVTGYQTNGDGTLAFPIGGNATIRNCTISGNTATRGGGIYVASGNLLMDSTIVAGNTATQIANDVSGFVDGQNNLIGDGTGAFLLSSNNLVGVNPLLANLADNGGPTMTMALLPGSPAIDAGSNLDNLAFDQRGLSRTVGAGTDIGAFEVQTPEPSSLALILGGLLLLKRPRRRTVV